MSSTQNIVIKFAGDSGDGMQLTGSQFTMNTALLGYFFSTFPDFPAEIRAPQGTLAGVSGYQLHFSQKNIYTPGDEYDVLVAMNAAALKMNLKNLKKGSFIIVDKDGFDTKNLRLANIPEEDNPLTNNSLENYTVLPVAITQLTRETLADFKLMTKEKDRAKNMFVLGILYFAFGRNKENTLRFLNDKFKTKTDILNANIKCLEAGFAYAETIELSWFKNHTLPEYQNDADKTAMYRHINGNTAMAYGLISVAEINHIPIFLGSYPITPASDILHELSKHKNFNVITYQAEDEIASIGAAIGASYGGSLGVTSTSGPGMALKTEGIGLAISLEIPLVIINVQRAGPSTGLPTKTEQADLLQAFYGRNGEAPLPVIAPQSPKDCFEIAREAARIAIEHMTPVIILSDGFIANSSEPWQIPDVKNLSAINVQYQKELPEGAQKFEPYRRNDKLVRAWVKPGTPNLEHRIGGLEKQDITGNVSYDPENHQHMVLTRQKKIDLIADYIPLQTICTGAEKGDVLIIGWGSTYGVIKSVVSKLHLQGVSIGHIHIRYIKPFPSNLKDILKQFKTIIVPEINNGHLIKIIREQFLIDAIGFNKIKGVPIEENELLNFVTKYIKTK